MNRSRFPILIIVSIIVFILIFNFPQKSFCQNTETKKTEEVKQEKQEDEKSTNIYEEDDERPERLKFYKKKYEFFFKNSFEIVVKAVKKGIADFGCIAAQQTNKQNSDGLLSTKIVSDYCIFAQGTDTTVFELEKYSLRLPLIYGGKWRNGRVQFKFSIDEQNSGNVRLVLKAEISGFEEFVTWEFHFWESGGLMEHNLMEIVLKNIKEASEKKE